MVKPPVTRGAGICATVNPGICGLPCSVQAFKRDAHTVTVGIGETECKQIQKMGATINTITLRQLFAPLTRNLVYVAAQQAGCHASCPVPAAVLKAAEVAMGMALPKKVSIKFTACNEVEND